MSRGVLCANYPRCGDTTGEYEVALANGTVVYLGGQCLDDALALGTAERWKAA